MRRSGCEEEEEEEGGGEARICMPIIIYGRRTEAG